MPRFGDVTAYRDEKSEYIYLLGGAPNQTTDSSFNNIYQARVLAADAFDLSRYEYWWGEEAGWKADVLSQFDDTTAIMSNVGQGQMVWNEHFQAYIFVYLGEFVPKKRKERRKDLADSLGPGGFDVLLRTVPSPDGPWSEDVKVYTATPIDNGLAYAGVAHPYLDTTGQTLTVSFTNNNHHQALKVTFE